MRPFTYFALVATCLLAPVSARANPTVPLEIWDLVQNGEGVEVEVWSDFEEGSFTLKRSGADDSKLVAEDEPLTGPNTTYEVTDDCVPAGTATYRLYHLVEDECYETDSQSLTVTDVGQDCPDTTSDFSCENDADVDSDSDGDTDADSDADSDADLDTDADTDADSSSDLDSGDAGCSMIPGPCGGPATLLLVLAGLIALLFRHR